MTNRQFGVRILYSMLLKNPPLASFFNTNKDSTGAGSTTSTAPTVSSSLSNSSIKQYPGDCSPPGKRHMMPIIVLPKSNGEVCPASLTSRTAEVVAAVSYAKKRSLDLLGNPRFHEVGDRIMCFMGELIDSMRMAQPDQVSISVELGLTSVYTMFIYYFFSK